MSIDGKRLCGSRQEGKEAIVHMVSAWSSANHLVPGSYKVDDKSWPDNGHSQAAEEAGPHRLHRDH